MPVAVTAVMDMTPLHAPELSEAVAHPRLLRQTSSGSGRHQAISGSSGTPKKLPQRGLSLAELERLRWKHQAAAGLQRRGCGRHAGGDSDVV